MSNKIGQPPVAPQPREVQKERPAAKKTDETTTRGAQASASVQMESLAQRVKGGKAVAGTSLLLQQSHETEAPQTKPGNVSARWAIQGLLQDEGGGGHQGGDQEESLPEIPLIDVPYDVVTSPLGRAYRAVRWLKAYAQMEQASQWLQENLAHDSAELQEARGGMRAHQDKRRALVQAETFFRSERQRMQLELNKALAAALTAGESTTPVQAQRFGLPSATLSWPPMIEQAALDQVTATGEDTLGGGEGVLADIDGLLTQCAELKGKYVDETVDPEARWTAAWASVVSALGNDPTAS